MKHPKDITGIKFHRLTVLRRAERQGYWICKCDCGEETETRKDRLVTGWTKSCGCLFLEVKTTHGNTKKKERSKTYRSWANMKSRCYYTKSLWYDNYGGRGIKVCDRWKNSFQNFLEDMGESPEGMSLDKIDNNKDYEPGNCRWATIEEQTINRRPPKNAILITREGRTQFLKHWCIELNLPYGIILHRISQLKWDPEIALTTPIRSLMEN